MAAAEIGGLTADSTGADLAEAALIGVAHQIVDAIDAVQDGLASPLGLIRVDGGLSRNDSALQAIADLSGLRLDRPAGVEVDRAGRRRAGRAGRRPVGPRRRWPPCPSRLVDRFAPGCPNRPGRRPGAAWQSVLAGVASGAASARGSVSARP